MIAPSFLSTWRSFCLSLFSSHRFLKAPSSPPSLSSQLSYFQSWAQSLLSNFLKYHVFTLKQDWNTNGGPRALSLAHLTSHLQYSRNSVGCWKLMFPKSTGPQSISPSVILGFLIPGPLLPLHCSPVPCFPLSVVSRPHIKAWGISPMPL